MNAILEFVLNVVIATITQMLVLFGPLLAVGFLIAFFEKMSNKMLMRIFSFKAVIFSTGWLGTPIHETGHAIFCLLFGHKIHEFVPFKPERDESGGYTLGYVKHSCKGSIYNNIGYLFIGTGPIILGSTIIALLIWLLLPGGSDFFGALRNHASGVDLTFMGYITMLWDTIKSTVEVIFWSDGWGTYGHWEFWVFFLVASCISLHMSLSPPDLKSAWKGAGIIALIFLVINIVLVAIGQTDYMKYFSAYIMLGAGVLFVGVILSFITMIIILIITSILGKLKG